jgi:alkylation response protein AidB-like acyl-CoA dehydrogenase
MSIAITDDHRTLGDTVAEVLRRRGSRAAARHLLEAETESLPDLWRDVVELGWLGVHLPEAYGGSSFGLEELVVIVEEMGRGLAPGPFVPTVITSAIVSIAAEDATKAAMLPGLADGSIAAGIALGADVAVRDGTVSGEIGAVPGGGLAGVFLVVSGDDVLLVDAGAGGVSVEPHPNMDPGRRSVRVTLDGAPVTVLPGAREVAVAIARVLLAAEAVGVARECTDLAAAYAKVRHQFGRPIATFQAVKHHCADMLVATELATAAVWDAARAASTGGAELSYAAAVAAALAGPAANQCANLAIQVHGGIGFTWEHDAHLFLRRATVLNALLEPERAAADLTQLVRDGVGRARTLDLPAEAEAVRTEVRAFVERVAGMDAEARRETLLESGYAMAHWPRPWGRDAGAVEQLVIEQEFAAAGITRPQYGITGWIILTLIQHGTDDQVARWVPPALRHDVIWCQLFSEPDAGSDAAGITTRGTRVDGGWLVNGQKVWTSGAHVAGKGFATVRTDPDAPKHAGITVMVVDMHAPGVTVRPLRMTTGDAEFNEVFFDDVFVPDDDVVGPVDGGWTVARATLGNESVSIGSGEGQLSIGADMMLPLFDAHPDRLPGGAARIGRYAAHHQATGLLNLRNVHRAVAGGGAGPEGAVTKLVLSENGHEAAAIFATLAGPDILFLDGPGAVSARLALMHRALSIAGGTSEIKRNQIGERLLGLPRDPLLK